MLILALLALLVVPVRAAADGAPDPGGDEHANVRLGAGLPAGKYFGFNQQTPSWGSPNIYGGPIAAAASQAGANAIRTSLPWSLLEPVKGQWNESAWKTYADVYSAFLAQGITPVFNIGWAPAWARDPAYQACGNNTATCRYPPSSAHDADWKRFAAEVARRFPLATLEIWNEPNFWAFWMPQPDPERWAQLVDLGYDAIKAVNPSQLVLTGGLVSWPATGAGSMSVSDFLARAYGAQPSIAGHYDAIGFHLYSENADEGAGSWFARAFAEIRGATAAGGDPGAKLWLDEYGLMAPGGPSPFTLDGQADGLGRMVRRTLTMSDVQGVMIHTLLDAGAGAPADEQNFGVMSRSPHLFTPKPSYCRLAYMASNAPDGCPAPTAIDTSIDPKPSGPAPRPEFALTSSDPSARFECSVDGGDWRTCQTPLTLSNLADGRHSLAVRAYDDSGAEDDSSASMQFDVDATPPDTTLESVPPNPLASDVARFSLAAGEPGSVFRCSFDGAAWQPCEAQVVWRGLADGPHTFAAQAIDPAGNVDPTPATDSVVVAATPAGPAITIASPTTPMRNATGSTDPLTGPSPRFGFTAAKAESYECSVDGAAFSPCTQPFGPAAALAAGPHTVAVQGMTESGRAGLATTQSFQVDDEPPTIEGPRKAGLSFTGRVRMHLKMRDESGTIDARCSLDGRASHRCGQRLRLGRMRPGGHRLTVEATDLFGNASAPKRIRFRVLRAR